MARANDDVQGLQRSGSWRQVAEVTRSDHTWDVSRSPQRLKPYSKSAVTAAVNRCATQKLLLEHWCHRKTGPTAGKNGRELQIPRGALGRFRSFVLARDDKREKVSARLKPRPFKSFCVRVCGA